MKSAGDNLGALMQKLIKRVLAVGAGLAPEDGAGSIIHMMAVARDALTVALHVALLEIGREVTQILVIRENGVRLRVKEIVVPDTEQRQNHRHIIFKRRSSEVLIHAVRADQ